jgi:hypothetical protein
MRNMECSSTGFGPGGAAVEAVALMRRVVGSRMDGSKGLGRDTRCGYGPRADPGGGHHISLTVDRAA